MPLSQRSLQRSSSTTSRDHERVHKLIVRENIAYNASDEKPKNPIKLTSLGKIKVSNQSQRANLLHFSKEEGSKTGKQSVDSVKRSISYPL